jgi:hypothetical protein
MGVPVPTPNPIYAPYGSVDYCRAMYVEWTAREHWMRQQLHKVRAALWRPTDAAEKERLVLDEGVVEWLYSEAQHWMVWWRAMLATAH